MRILTDGSAAFDQDGQMARRGRMDEGWLGDLMEHPYYRRRGPKSTGRELFGPQMARVVWPANGRGTDR